MKIITIVCKNGHSFCATENDLLGKGDEVIQCIGLIGPAGKGLSRCTERWTGNELYELARGNNLIDLRNNQILKGEENGKAGKVV